jgi:hypothetical protein
MSRVKLTLLVSIDTVGDRFTKEGSKTQKVEVDEKQSFALDGETIRSDKPCQSPFIGLIWALVGFEIVHTAPRCTR